MTTRKAWLAWAAGLLLATGPARAQVPAPLGAAGPFPSAALSPAATAAGGAAAPRTIWGFLGLSKSNLQACRDKLCRSQLGIMLNSLASGPVGAISGGFIPPLCPIALTPAQIAAMGNPGGAEAVAAKIKASEADAKARVAAVEYLGTVDCSRWDEATDAIIGALRADKNECVRYAAARVLSSGCCCNKKTIEALRTSVSGEDKDGNPPENSPRVKAAAFNALQGCLARVPEVLPEEEEVKPVPARREGEKDLAPKVDPLPKPRVRERTTQTGPEAGKASEHEIAQASVETPVEPQPRSKSFARTVTEARQTLFHVARTPAPPSSLPPGKKSMLNVLLKSRQDVDARNRRLAGPPPGGDADVQGPAIPPADPGVVPSSYVPAANPGQADAAPVGDPTLAPQGRPRRGLIGNLIDARNRQPQP